MKKRLVLFDFDGTLTRKDTLLEFILYYHGWARFIFGFAILSPTLLLLKTGILSNQRAKERVLRYFFSGVSVKEFNYRCLDFATNKLPRLLRSDGLASLTKAIQEGDDVCIVSASPENWIKPWSDPLGIRCLATQLHMENNSLTGFISGLNCYGAEKVSRIKQAFVLESYTEIIAYGDSRGDKEMLAISHKPHYKFFHE